MERIYHKINEETARVAKTINSFSDYISGSATLEYKTNIDNIYDLVEKIVEENPNLAERAIGMVEYYNRKLAKYYNDYYRNEASCPSVMICGAGNFPMRKKEKQNNRRDTLMNEWGYLQRYVNKIQNILTINQPILSNDKNAVELLEEKLEKMESVQAMMKAANAYYRKNKTLDDCPVLTLEQIDKLKDSMSGNNHYENKPFLSYELTNNNANIKSTTLRLQKLKKEKETGTQEQVNQYFTIVENKELMRLQLIFKDKPEPEVRDILKSNGFRWSPKNGCWQRQLTDNARYSAERVIQELKK